MEVASAYVSLLPSTAGFRKRTESLLNGEIGRTGEKQGRGIGDRLASGMGKTLKIGAVGVAAAAGGLAATALAKGFSRLNAIDQAEAKLRGLGHTTGEITQIMQNATAAVTGTAFGLDEAATAAASALASGVEPGRQLEKYLTLIGDAATQGGTSFNEMASIINKTTATGKVGMENLNQLSERGIGIMSWLADEYGVTGAELAKMVSRGEVDTKTFRKVLEDNIGGAAQESGKTFSGSLANMNAALGRIGAKVLSGAFAQMPAMFQNLGVQIDKLGPFAERAGAAIGGALTAAIAYLVPLAQSIATYIGTFIAQMQSGEGVGGAFAAVMQALGGALLSVASFLGNNLEAVGTFVAIVGTAIAVSRTWIAVQKVLNLVLAANPIGLVVVAIAALAAGVVFAYKKSETFRGIVQAVGKVITGTVIPAVQKVATLFAGLFVGAVSAAISIGKSIISTAASIGRAFLDVVRDVAQFVSGLKQKFNDAMNFVRGIPGKVIGAFAGFGSLLYNKGKELIQGLIDGIMAMVGKVKDAIGKVTGTIGKFLPGSPVKEGPLRSWNRGGAGKRLMAMLAEGISKGGPAVERAIEKVTAKIAKQVDKWKGLRDAARDFSRSVADAFRPDVMAGGLLEMQATLNDSLRDLQRLPALTRKLGRNLGKGFFSDLMQSGNFGLIAEMGALSPAELRQLNRQWNQVQRRSAQVGKIAARQAGYTAAERDQLNVLRAIERGTRGVADETKKVRLALPAAVRARNAKART